jgi:hypothetical protein
MGSVTLPIRKAIEMSDQVPEPETFHELPDSPQDVSDKLLYAVAGREDGGVLLTVFSGGESASVELSDAMVGQLIELLRSRGRRSS